MFFLFLKFHLFVCFVCAAIIISGSGYSISTTGFLRKILAPLLREFQEILSLHQINEVSEHHAYIDMFHKLPSVS